MELYLLLLPAACSLSSVLVQLPLRKELEPCLFLLRQ
jgi:hypothetical protein